MNPPAGADMRQGLDADASTDHRRDTPETDDASAEHRAAYRRARDLVANATTEHLIGLLGSDDDLKRTAARDELHRRREHVST
jgi:hypothetical protein